MTKEKQQFLDKKNNIFHNINHHIQEVIENGGKCSAIEYHLVLNEMIDRYYDDKKLRMLVFGCGIDTRLWAESAAMIYRQLNMESRPELTFIENSQKYMKLAEKDLMEVNKYEDISVNWGLRFYQYGTKNLTDDPDQFIIDNPKWEDWIIDMPSIMTKSWDIVFVDGPCRKRQNSIATALKFNDYYGASVFIHDVDRYAERQFIKYILGGTLSRMTQIGRMGVIK